MEFDGKNYHNPEDLAGAILSSRGIDNKLNIEILGSAPYANQLSPERFDFAKDKLGRANQILLGIKILLTSVVCPAITNDSFENNIENAILKSNDPKANTYKALQLLDILLTQPTDSIEKMGFDDKNAFQLSLLQEGIGLTKKLYSDIPDSEFKKMMLNFTVYYSALQVLILGMQTNSILLLHDPENFMKSETNSIGMAVSMITSDGHEKTKMKMLFEGYTILDEKKSKDGASYLVIQTNGPDEDPE